MLLATVVATASCALFESEDSLSPSPTITATVATVAPAPSTETAPPPPTTVSAAPTTSTVAPTTTRAPSVGRALLYLEQLLFIEAELAALAEDIDKINEDWDNRAQAEVTFTQTESALETAAEQARRLQDAFGPLAPPTDFGLESEHRTARAAVETMSEMLPQMLEGLRSTDTGEARQTALVGFRTAFDLFRGVLERVAGLLGEEGEALLAANRTSTPGSAPSIPDTTSTTVSAAPPNPGNTKNCSDFSTHQEAQEWFDVHFPFYGDVAQIDTNGNGVACEDLRNNESG